MALSPQELNKSRKDYPGEFIITGIKIVNRKKTHTKEFIENPIKNQHISARCCILGTHEKLMEYPIKHIENHKGGLLGALSLQLYASDQVFEYITPNFTYCNDPVILSRMVKTDYPEQSVVYTSTKNVLKFPGQFYIVPYQVNLLPEATLAWLASFDGHKEIFLLGFDDKNEKVIDQMKSVMEAFPDVNYTRVFWDGSRSDKEDPNCPEAWKWCQNFREMNKQYWISYCDI